LLYSFGPNNRDRRAQARSHRPRRNGASRRAPASWGIKYGLSWLKVFLEGDERYRQFLLETPSRESDFRDNL
jgi:hypothetical protein